jgi:hypothetical protein
MASLSKRNWATIWPWELMMQAMWKVLATSMLMLALPYTTLVIAARLEGFDIRFGGGNNQPGRITAKRLP